VRRGKEVNPNIKKKGPKRGRGGEVRKGGAFGGGDKVGGREQRGGGNRRNNLWLKKKKQREKRLLGRFFMGRDVGRGKEN